MSQRVGRDRDTNNGYRRQDILENVCLQDQIFEKVIFS
jgi:hypothetical protein